MKKIVIGLFLLTTVVLAIKNPYFFPEEGGVTSLENQTFYVIEPTTFEYTYNSDGGIESKTEYNVSYYVDVNTGEHINFSESKVLYNYDSLGNLVLEVHYNLVEEKEHPIPTSKIEYKYDGKILLMKQESYSGSIQLRETYEILEQTPIYVKTIMTRNEFYGYERSVYQFSVEYFFDENGVLLKTESNRINNWK